MRKGKLERIIRLAPIEEAVDRIRYLTREDFVRLMEQPFVSVGCAAVVESPPADTQDPKGEPCPDCAHTDHPGQYWGAIEAEPCETCEGTAKVLSDADK